MLALLDNVEKDYGAQAVLRGVTLAVEPGDRLALVGRNGAGKSTLLRLLTGAEKPDGGTVRWSPGVRARALRQDPTFDADATVHEILDAAFHDLDALEVELSAAAAAMHDDASIAQHAELLEHYARRGGFERRARRDAVALAFGFRGREGERVGKLSGGERTRLGLAALLVENPDVLLLDEPTNHLDIVMVEWLEGFLGRYPGALLLVSHDRAFLDAVSSETAHLWHGQLRRYPGNYSAFREGLEAELERQAAKYAQESRKIADFEKSTARMKIWGLGMSKLARRAKSMETRLERMRAAASAPPPPEERTSSITFYAPESGEVVLDARHVSKTLGGRPLFRDLDLTIRRGERIALIGRNGAGKTTLLRALLGLSPSDDARSEVRLGSRVKLGYYDQQLRGVDEDSTLYREARDLVQKDQEAHDLLGTFMFPYDTHDKRVSVLSGGERARLALLKLAQEDNNFLVLDEPSNHLDMEMLESLEAALDAYTGTLLMVSHDRRLIENLADRIWLLEDGRFYEYPGGYAYYKEKHQPLSTEPEPVRTVMAEARPKTKGLWHLKRQLESVEAEVAELESRLERAQQAIAAAAPDADFARLGTAAADLETALNAKLQEWETVQGEVEARA